MIIRFKPAALGQTRSMTVIAGFIAARSAPSSAAVRERKENAGFPARGAARKLRRSMPSERCSESSGGWPSDS